jgi:hypothetical protein
VQVVADNVTLQCEAGEFAFAHDYNQASRLKFLHVVRQGSGADSMSFEQSGVRHRRFGSRKLSDNLDAPRLRKNFGDSVKLTLFQRCLRGFSTCSRIPPIRL